MKALCIVPVFFAVAACDVPNNSTRADASGSAQIQLQDGRNCWDNQCMRFNSRNGSFYISGRVPVRPPAGSIQSGGYISVAAFQQTFHTAMRAESPGDLDR